MKKTKNIKVLVVKPLKKPYLKMIPHTLNALQQEVDGHIQIFFPLYTKNDVAIICNEEGKLNGLPLNRGFYKDSGDIYEIIAGTFLVVGLDKDDFCSLTDEQVEKYTNLFKIPELFFNCHKGFISIPKNDYAANRKLEIYQLKKDDPISQKMKFLSFNRLLEYHYPVIFDRYDLVYSCALSPDETLEQIYIRFNGCLGYFPDDYKGHSLSVSDVIVICENGKKTVYFVDSVDFLELDGFFR